MDTELGNLQTMYRTHHQRAQSAIHQENKWRMNIDTCVGLNKYQIGELKEITSPKNGSIASDS